MKTTETDHGENGDERDEEDLERIEVHRGRLAQATTRDPFAPLAELESVPENVHVRQAAIGEHRKYAGPVFEEVLTPAALSVESDEDDVEPTEVAAAPNDEESDEHE